MRISKRRRGRSERGSSNLVVVLTVVSLIVLVGLVVDGAGKVQASAQAQHVAASAARAAVSSLAGETILGAPIAIDADAAEAVALDYVAAAGMRGTASVTGDRITVTASTTAETAFLSLIGIESLPATGEAHATLIDGTGESVLGPATGPGAARP